MSVRSSIFYGPAQGNTWHVWHNCLRGDGRHGVFLELWNMQAGEEDEWGYPNLEVELSKEGADILLFLPLEACESIAKWVEERNNRNADAHRRD